MALIDLFQWLLITEQRERMSVIIDVWDEIGVDNMALLPWLAPEDLDTDEIARYLRSRLLELRQVFQELPSDFRTWFNSLDVVRARPRLKRYLGILQRLRDRISDDTLRQVLMHLDSLTADSDLSAKLVMYEGAIESFEESYGDAKEASFRLLESWVKKNQYKFKGDKLRESTTLVDHNWVDEHGKKAPLCYFAHPDSTQGYGFVNIPLVIETNDPRSCSFRLDVQVKSGHREAWPKNWENPQPTSLKILHQEWRQNVGEETHVYTFRMEIPISLTRKSSRRFEAEIRLFDEATDVPVGKPKTLTWETIETIEDPLGLAWPETTDPNFVRKHPIGPQQKSTDIMSRLVSGGSFAVVAPRRFGKTTLMEYIKEQALASGFVVPDPIVCTSYHSGHEIEYAKIWEEISNRLLEQLEAPVKKVPTARLPEMDGFDFVRRAAKKAGKAGILLLFDEAQLFFPTKDGYLLGDLLKDRLERNWARRDNPKMVPLVFGFVALPSFHERAGANLCGLLRPHVANQMTESELNKVILHVTSGKLSTTREARMRLAKSAGNLFILKTLVQELIEDLRGERRVWINYNDVTRVENELKNSLREGSEKEVSVLVRDALNDAETINLWSANPSFAAALALALARSQGARASSHICDSAKDLLNQWCEAASADPTKRYVFDDRRLNEHLKVLNDRGVFRDREFPSEFLESWLLGYLKQVVPEENSWKEILFKGAMVRLRLPATLERENEGGEATVYSFVDGNFKYALRKTELKTEDERTRFADSIDTLEILRSCIERRELGSDYVFKLHQMGLSDEEGIHAVQIYHWIDGTNLTKREGQLSSLFTVDIGLKLAKAVSFLHKHNILHRDIVPSNVIFSEDGFKPVLIDFGFARRLGQAAKTQLGSDYSAPEVRGSSPTWSKAADIYSLSMTLKTLTNPSQNHRRLSDILLQCLSENPEDRPDADVLVSSLESLARDLHLEEKRSQEWDRIEQITVPDHGVSWFTAILAKFRPNIEAMMMGFVGEPFDRCKEVANLLNQLLESYSDGKPVRLRLSLVKDRNEMTQDHLATQGVKFLHKVRNHLSHGGGTKFQIMQEFNNPSADTIRKWAIESAEGIATVTGAKSLSTLVNHIL